jgi:hypothetical protein
MPRALASAAGESSPVEMSGGVMRHQGGFIYDLDRDPGRDRLRFGGLEGRVCHLDLSTGRSGVLLEPPGRPPIHRLGLSRHRSTLALTCHPDMYARGRNRRGPLLQFWNYTALCRETRAEDRPS